MSDGGIGDYFISDVDDSVDEDDELLAAPVVVPVAAPQPAAEPPQSGPSPVQPAPVQAPAAQPVRAAAGGARPQVAVRQATREERLVEALDYLMENSQDVQAAALVSLDGFT